MKIRSVAEELNRVDGQTDMLNLIVSFCYFANAHKNLTCRWRHSSASHLFSIINSKVQHVNECISLKKQQTVDPHRYTILQQKKKTWPTYNRPTLKRHMFLQKYKDKQFFFFCANNILTDGMFVTKLTTNTGISVWWTVSFTINRNFLSYIISIKNRRLSPACWGSPDWWYYFSTIM